VTAFALFICEKDLPAHADALIWRARLELWKAEPWPLCPCCGERACLFPVADFAYSENAARARAIEAEGLRL
jgi:hypothetical protein